MAGTQTTGGLVVTVRICRVLWRREKEWSGLGWPYSTMKLYQTALGISALEL